MLFAGQEAELEVAAAVDDDQVLEEDLGRDVVSSPALKLPQVVGGDGEEALYDRMALYEELHFILVAFLNRFAAERTGPTWEASTLPMMRRWVSGLEMEDLVLESKLDALDGVDNPEGTS